MNQERFQRIRKERLARVNLEKKVTIPYQFKYLMVKYLEEKGLKHPDVFTAYAMYLDGAHIVIHIEQLKNPENHDEVIQTIARKAIVYNCAAVSLIQLFPFAQEDEYTERFKAYGAHRKYINSFETVGINFLDVIAMLPHGDYISANEIGRM